MHFRRSVVALLAGLLAAPASPGQRRQVTADEVRRVHESALLIDTHNDVTGLTVNGFDLAQHNAKGHTDLARLKQGGVGAVFFAVYVAAGYVSQNRSAHRALEVFDSVRRDIAARHPREFMLALSADDIEAARRGGRIAALIGVEGGHAIEDSLRLLRIYYDLGARYMTLTHSNTNNWADSSGDIGKPGVKHHNGLTAFGREVVAEMNRLGMMVDVSHVSDKTFWDVLAASSAPVFASHSSCRALADMPRNLTDEMIVALARKGGVVQINFGCEFLSQKSVDTSPWTNPELAAKARGNRKLAAELQARMTRATIADVVAHIDHVVKLAGVDAVGIGSDFDGVSCVPEGLDDYSKMPNLTRALLERGYSAGDIRKIYGGNTLRLMRQVERMARR